MTDGPSCRVCSRILPVGLSKNSQELVVLFLSQFVVLQARGAHRNRVWPERGIPDKDSCEDHAGGWDILDEETCYMLEIWTEAKPRRRLQNLPFFPFGVTAMF